MRPRTLAGLLRARAGERGVEVALRCRDGDGWRERDWASYWDGARRAAAGLWAAGVRPGARVLMLVPEVEGAVLTLFGAWAIGAVPVQVGLPYRLNDVAAFIDSLRQTAEGLGASLLVISAGLAPFAGGSELSVVTAEELLVAGLRDDLPDPEDFAGEPALVQLTSGSTGRPRGVVLAHDRLMHHLASMSQALPSHENSVAVSWLPLHHDMGLIGGLLFPFFNGFVAHMLSPAEFRARPLSWLEVMAQTRATICAAPPSAYAMLLRVAPRATGLDLSRWECAMIGAEPIAASLLRRFADAFAAAGFRANAFFPVYGLAEATVAVTFPRLLAATRVDRVDRLRLERDGVAAATEGGPALELVAVGRPIPGTELRVVDAAGEDLPERRVGELRVRAPSLMRGYHGDPAATEAALAGGWLRTGDLGYVADGELFITGRSKEIIIRGGLNVIPAVIEAIAGEVEGVRAGGVAAVGVFAAELETELVYVVAETRVDEASWPALRLQIDHAMKTGGVAVDRVILVPPGSLPRTTSGKLRRREVAEALARGAVPG